MIPCVHRKNLNEAIERTPQDSSRLRLHNKAIQRPLENRKWISSRAQQWSLEAQQLSPEGHSEVPEGHVDWRTWRLLSNFGITGAVLCISAHSPDEIWTTKMDAAKRRENKLWTPCMLKKGMTGAARLSKRPIDEGMRINFAVR